MIGSGASFFPSHTRAPRGGAPRSAGSHLPPACRQAGTFFSRFIGGIRLTEMYRERSGEKFFAGFHDGCRGSGVLGRGCDAVVVDLKSAPAGMVSNGA